METEYRDYAKKEAERIKNEIKGGNFDTVFAFIPDLHYKCITEMRVTVGNIISVINDVNKEQKVDFAVLGGDNVGNYPPSPEEHIDMMRELNEYFSALDMPWLVCQGNHDDNSIHGHKENMPPFKSASGFEVPDSVQYDVLFSHQRSYANFISPDAEKALYGAYDMPQKRMRVIVLNGDEVPHMIEKNGWLKYSQQWDYGYSGEQLRWLGEKALNVDGETDIVLIEHIPFPGGLENDGAATNGDVLTEIIKSAMSGGSYKSHCSDGDFPYDVDVDFSSRKINVIARICGHIHKDAHLLRGGILDISSAAAGRNNSGVARDENGRELIKTPYSAKETCFDFYCINKEKRVIKTVRYGIGDGRTFNY